MPEAKEVVLAFTDQNEDKIVWHNAASWEDFVSALGGGPYTAKCGAKCKGKAGVFRHRSLLSPIERCVVCRETVEAGG